MNGTGEATFCPICSGFIPKANFAGGFFSGKICVGHMPNVQPETEKTEAIRLTESVDKYHALAMRYADLVDRFMLEMMRRQRAEDALDRYTQNPELWPKDVKEYPAKWAEEALAENRK